MQLRVSDDAQTLPSSSICLSLQHALARAATMSELAEVVSRPSEAVVSLLDVALGSPNLVVNPSDEVANRPEQSDARHVDQTERSQEAGANQGDSPTIADKWQQSLSHLGLAASDFARKNNISRRYAIETMLKCCGWTKYSVEDVEVAIQLSRGQSHQPSPEVIEISDDSDSAKEATPAERTTTTKKRRGKAEPWSIEQHIVTVRCILHAGRQGGSHWRNIAAHVNQVGGNKRSISVMQKTFWEVRREVRIKTTTLTPIHRPNSSFSRLQRRHHLLIC